MIAQEGRQEENCLRAVGRQTVRGADLRQWRNRRRRRRGEGEEDEQEDEEEEEEERDISLLMTRVSVPTTHA